MLIASAGGSAVCLATLAGFGGRLWWVLDLFSHFQVQYFFLIVLFTVVLLLLKRLRTAASLGACAALNLALISPYYLDQPRITGNVRSLRAVSINVNTANESYDLARRFIDESNPDLVLLMEVNGAWVRSLSEIESRYPHHKAIPREDNFGIALYSRLPFARCEIVYLGKAGVPSILAELDSGGELISILCTHPVPPISAEYSRIRNDQIEAVSQYLASISGPKVLIGDLNVSPWSVYFRALAKRAGVIDASAGFGIGPTWPTHRALLRIPIDLCLVSPEIGVDNRMIGPNIGSDHFPLLVDLALPVRDASISAAAR
jgi:endonuclease/exonuclease/phosphatase (EEP) superfamily protein YafD